MELDPNSVEARELCEKVILRAYTFSRMSGMSPSDVVKATMDSLAHSSDPARVSSREEQLESLSKSIRRMWKSTDTSATSLAELHLVQAEERVIKEFSSSIRSIKSFMAALGTVPGRVATEVSELPDRNSPEENPDMLMVTSEELTSIVQRAIEKIINEADLLQKIDRDRLKGEIYQKMQGYYDPIWLEKAKRKD